MDSLKAAILILLGDKHVFGWQTPGMLSCLFSIATVCYAASVNMVQAFSRTQNRHHLIRVFLFCGCSLLVIYLLPMSSIGFAPS